jgi:hypothetical protein
VPGDPGDRRRQGKDDMVIRHRQQFRLAVGQPVTCSRSLALRAMPVAAAAVLDLRVLTVVAAHDRTDKLCGAAGFDGSYGGKLVTGPGKEGGVSVAVEASHLSR